MGKRGTAAFDRQTGVLIKREFGLVEESRSGLIALLHRLGLAYQKPDASPRKRADDAGAIARCLRRAFLRTPFGILARLDPRAKLAAMR